MFDTRFNCLATMIGNMPHMDAVAACETVTRYLKDIPAWPQMSRRSFLENMYVQFSEGFPGVVVEQDRIYINCSGNNDVELEKLYDAYLSGDDSKYAVSKEYAYGLYQMLATDISPLFIKGQVTGPVSWGLTVTDENKRAIVYDETLGDVVPKFLRLKAGWQEKMLHKIAKNTIIFLDEPYMSSFGSAVIPLSGEKVINMLNEVFKGIHGIKGIHCCGNTDWPVLLATDTDVINYDTYNYAQSLALYPKDVKKFLARRGAIAWGIVPNTEEDLQKETVASLNDRLEEAMSFFTRQGIEFKLLIEQGLLTPSCSLAGMSVDMAEYALELLTELSKTIRSKYIN